MRVLCSTKEGPKYNPTIRKGYCFSKYASLKLWRPAIRVKIFCARDWRQKTEFCLVVLTIANDEFLLQVCSEKILLQDVYSLCKPA